MNRIFDYNGAAVSHSKPVKQLKTTKKFLVIDSGDRDVQKYPHNGDFVVYLPRVYENVVSIRLAGAEFPSADQYLQFISPVNVLVDPAYFIIDIEGLNKTDECSVGADRSGYPDGIFAKIPMSPNRDLPTLYNDHSNPENIGHYAPAIGKLDRMHIRTRYHVHKQNGGFIYWADTNNYTDKGHSIEYSLTFEIEMLDNSFDNFSSFESRVADRA